eukprot:514293-Rhodomonas_salina.4
MYPARSRGKRLSRKSVRGSEERGRRRVRRSEAVAREDAEKRWRRVGSAKINVWTAKRAVWSPESCCDDSSCCSRSVSAVYRDQSHASLLRSADTNACSAANPRWKVEGGGWRTLQLETQCSQIRRTRPSNRHQGRLSTSLNLIAPVEDEQSCNVCGVRIQLERLLEAENRVGQARVEAQRLCGRASKSTRHAPSPTRFESKSTRFECWSTHLRGCRGEVLSALERRHAPRPPPPRRACPAFPRPTRVSNVAGRHTRHSRQALATATFQLADSERSQLASHVDLHSARTPHRMHANPARLCWCVSFSDRKNRAHSLGLAMKSGNTREKARTQNLRQCPEKLAPGIGGSVRGCSSL